MNDDDILNKGGTEYDINSFAHDNGACGAILGGTCDYCGKTDMPTNKPNLEVPNHTDKIDEILDKLMSAKYDGFGNEIDEIEAKAQLRNYIAEEIKAVIGQLETTTPEPNDRHWTYTPEAIERDNLRNNQLAEAKNRGHNV